MDKERTDLLTRLQTAKLLKVTVRTVDNLTRQGLLKPVGKGKGVRFARVDVNAYLLLTRKMDLPTVANIAMRALARAEQCEKQIEQLLEALNFYHTPLDTSEEAVLRFYKQAEKLRQYESPLFVAAEVFDFAKRCLTVTESYFELVEQYAFIAEPWRPFLDAAKNLITRAPRHLFAEDRELGSAYGYLSVAQKHLRATAYFYVRQQLGKKAADDAFYGDNAFEPIIGTMFTN